MRQNHSILFTKKQRLLLMLPLLTLPFLTTLFWVIKGGATRPTTPAKKGFNMELPDARLQRDQPWDKLQFYNQAEADSSKAGRKQDDFRVNDSLTQWQPGLTGFQPLTPMDIKGSPAGHQQVEAGIGQRLQDLENIMHQPASYAEAGSIPATATGYAERSGDIERLEALMQNLQAKSAEDPELASLNGVLDKVLDIQHPKRVAGGAKEAGNGIFTVTPSRNSVPVNDLGVPGKEQRSRPGNAFYGESQPAAEDSLAATLEAEICQSQTISANSVVKLRLLSAVNVGGVQVPGGSFVYARSSLEDGRVQLRISSIRYQQYLFAVSLMAYDLDGLPGIAITGTSKNNAITASAGQEAMELTSVLDPSLKGRMAAAGIQAAKGWFSKREKAAKIKVTAGYSVLLRQDYSSPHP